MWNSKLRDTAGKAFQKQKRLFQKLKLSVNQKMNLIHLVWREKKKRRNSYLESFLPFGRLFVSLCLTSMGFGVCARYSSERRERSGLKA